MQDPPTSEEDNAAIIKAINETNRDLLWIGMTAPKQEKWTRSFYGTSGEKGINRKV